MSISSSKINKNILMRIFLEYVLYIFPVTVVFKTRAGQNWGTLFIFWIPNCKISRSRCIVVPFWKTICLDFQSLFYGFSFKCLRLFFIRTKYILIIKFIYYLFSNYFKFMILNFVNFCQGFLNKVIGYKWGKNKKWYRGNHWRWRRRFHIERGRRYFIWNWFGY